MRERFSNSKEQAFFTLSERVEYRDSTFISKLNEQRRRGVKHPFILCSDIDRSFIQRDGDVDLERYKKATWEVASLLEQHSIPLVLVTGNDLPIVKRYVAEGWMPYPDIADVSVGAEKYVLQQGAAGVYKEDEDYRKKSEQTFPRDIIYPLSRVFLEELLIRPEMQGIDLNFQPRDMPENVESYRRYWESGNDPSFKPQWDQPPQPFKISWKSHDLHARPELAILVKTKLKQFESQLREKGFPGISTLYVPGPGYDDIDVTIAKDVPINWLSKATGICTTAFVGDSLNDLLAIMKAGNIGFVTGGARESLLSEVSALDAYQLNNALIGTRPEREGLHKYVVEGKPRAIYIDEHGRKGPEGILWFLNEIKTMYTPHAN